MQYKTAANLSARCMEKFTDFALFWFCMGFVLVLYGFGMPAKPSAAGAGATPPVEIWRKANIFDENLIDRLAALPGRLLLVCTVLYCTVLYCLESLSTHARI